MSVFENMRSGAATEVVQDLCKRSFGRILPPS